jgi:hypothetical protein
MKDPMSGSRETRMQVAQRALIEVLKQIPPAARVGVLVFGGSTSSGQKLGSPWVYPLGPLDGPRLESVILNIAPHGRTPLGEYLKKGADCLLAARRQQKGLGTFRLLVVSDGEATDPELLAQHLPEVLARGIVVDAIGVDMKQDHALATQVHSYRRGNDPKALTQALTAALAELGTQRDKLADREAYELVAALPAGAVSEILSVLTRPADHDIGTAAPQPTDHRTSAQPSAAELAGAQPAPLPPGTPTPRPDAQKSERSRIGWVLVLVVFAGIMGLLRRSRRRLR